MNASVAAILGGAAAVFLIGAVAIPDPDYVRLLGFWSLAMAAHMVIITARAVFAAIRHRTLSPDAAFFFGLLLMNAALVGQRVMGVLFRDFGISWLVTSDAFSLSIAAMIVAQALKASALQAPPGAPVSPLAVVKALSGSLIVGTALFLVVWAAR